MTDLAAFLFGPSTWPFTGALMLMILVGLVEAIGLGGSHIDVGVDIDADTESPFDWLGVGKVPLLVIFIVALGLFGMSGLLIQNNIPLPLPIAVLISAGVTIGGTGFFAGLLGRIWPQDETTIVSQQHLVAKRAVIISPLGPNGEAAEGKVRDAHGQIHYVSVLPMDAEPLNVNDEVLLVRLDGQVYRAIDPVY